MNKYIDIYRKNLTEKIVFVLFTILSFSAIYSLNRIYPLYVDDWVYSFVYVDYWSKPTAHDIPLKRIENISNIVESQYNHYFAWGGRTVAHTLAQSLLLINHTCRTIANSMVYIFFLLIIYLFCRRSEKYAVLLYLGLILSLFIFLPAFNQTILWITGSANYLWGTLILLTFIFFYFQYYITGRSRNNIVFSIFIFILGIIAGWTNENSVITTLLFLFLFLLFIKKTKKHIPVWIVLGIIGLTIGAAFMILAPGNFARVGIEVDLSGKSTIEIIKHQIKNFIYIYKTVHGVPILSLIYIALFFWQYKTEDKEKSRELKASFIFFLMAHFSICIMIFSPYFPIRASFFSVTLLIISVGILWNNMSGKYMKMINIVTMLLLCILFAYKYNFRYSHIANFHEIMEERYAIIDEEKKKGNPDIVFNKKIYFPKEFDLEDVTEDTLHWVNQAYINYFGIKSVRFDNTYIP